jgi:hypothetical protein
LILVDTVTFLLAAAVLGRLPHLTPTRVTGNDGSRVEKKERRWVALRDRHYLGLTAASAVASLQYWVLIQAVPLWVVLHTSAPRWVAAIVFFVASVAVAAMQVPATRSIDGPRTAARLLARSGPAFLVAWALIALASGPSASVAIAMLIAGVLVHSLAEVWQAAATFELSFAMAKAEAQGQYQGVMGTGHGLVESVAPYVVIALCVNGGKAGWITLAVIVTVAGFVCALIERHWAASRTSVPAQPVADPSAA